MASELRGPYKLFLRPDGTIYIRGNGRGVTVEGNMVSIETLKGAFDKIEAKRE